MLGVGTVLQGRYEIRGQLGRGGMGPVSYTHLDVYKRQVLAGTCAPDGHAPSRDLAEVYATAAGYPLQLALGYEINGDASDWLTTQGIPSIAIELTDHSRIEWDRNLAGTLAVLNHYAAACAGGACGGSDR